MGVATVAFAAGAALWRPMRTLRQPADQLLLFSAAAVTGLLVFYNRIYSATLLLLPLAWSLANWSEAGLRRYAIGLFLLTLAFLVPGAAAANVFLQNSSVSWPIPFWLRHLLLFHQVYLLAAMLVILCLAARKSAGAASRLSAVASGGP